MSEHDVDLEIKVAWLENSLAELDAVVRGLGDELGALRREVVELRATVARVPGAGDTPADAEGEDGLSYEVPPHY